MRNGRAAAVSLDGAHLEYRLIYSSAATQMRLRVGTGGVSVTLPKGKAYEMGEAFLFENRAWVLDQLHRVERLREGRRPLCREEGGLLFRGEPVRVVVEEHATFRGAAKVSVDSQVIRVVRGPHSPGTVRGALTNFLRGEARRRISAQIERTGFAGGRTLGKLYIMSQRTKWGNCSSRGNLSFNWRLIMAPDFVLRYMVVHEVVHLAIPDHSPKFWLTVKSLCADTERARQWLCRHEQEVMSASF